MIRDLKCSICGFENDPTEEALNCGKCGGFLTNKKKLATILKENNKKYKDDHSVPILIKDHPVFTNRRPIFSTASLALDKALLTGGLFAGSKIEIYGPESCGKTTLGLQLVAEFQKKNASCLYIDMEHTIDALYAERLGVDLDSFYLCQPDNGTQAIDIIGTSCELYDVIVVDTVACLAGAAFTAKVQKMDSKTGEIEDVQDFAGVARQMGVLQSKHGAKIGKSGCTLILLNQARENITDNGSYGIKSPGGRVMKHFCTQRVQMQRIAGAAGVVKDSDGVDCGFMVKAKIIKNKSQHEGEEAIMEFIWGEGFQKNREYVALAIECGFLQKAGAWIKDANGKTLCQGFDSTVDYFEQDENKFKPLRDAVDVYLRNMADGSSSNAMEVVNETVK